MARAGTGKEEEFQINTTSVSLDAIPANAIVVHATNCYGKWGAGFALALAKQFPNAKAIYSTHCENVACSSRRADLTGTCLLIPPVCEDYMSSEEVEEDTCEVDSAARGESNKRGVWIACLFTSYGYGRKTKTKDGVDARGKIINQTRTALQELRRQVDEMYKGGGGAAVKENRPDKNIYSPKFNSGSFGVKWEQTEELIQGSFSGWSGEWNLLQSPHS